MLHPIKKCILFLKKEKTKINFKRVFLRQADLHVHVQCIMYSKESFKTTTTLNLLKMSQICSSLGHTAAGHRRWFINIHYQWSLLLRPHHIDGYHDNHKYKLPPMLLSDISCLRLRTQEIFSDGVISPPSQPPYILKYS